jgi:hypothetical protein
VIVRGEALAAKIEGLLPALDQAVGHLIGTLAQENRGRRGGTSPWRSQAQALRAGLHVLAEAIARLAREAMPVDGFAPLWSTLIPLEEHGDPASSARRARKAAACYEPIWREIVRDASDRSLTPGEVARRKQEVEILCSRCRAPALRFAKDTRYTRVRLAPDAYAFLKPLVGDLQRPTALAAYLRKHLPYGLAEHCPTCGAFYCGTCSPATSFRFPHSDHEPTMTTCPKGHERTVDRL